MSTSHPGMGPDITRYACPYCGGVLGHTLAELPRSCPACAASTLTPKFECVPTSPRGTNPEPAIAKDSPSGNFGDSIKMATPYILGIGLLLVPQVVVEMAPEAPGLGLMHLLAAWTFTGAVPPHLSAAFEGGGAGLGAILIAISFFKATGIFLCALKTFEAISNS